MLGGNLDFAVMLERAIIKQLQGDGDGAQGLYQQILACQDWDSFNRIKGQIQGFEATLTLMRNVAHELNTGEEPAATRMRAN